MGNHNDTHGHGGASHGSVKEYVTGLILSIVLTVVPFGMVMTGAASGAVAIAVIMLCAIAQLLVQAIFFLHMNSSSEQSWNVSTGIYTLFIFVVVIIGSMWIFTHLHHNMLMGH
ncbi:cytochrome o ubiquinol oxidase subunit IV [Psychrobacter sp. HD31]|uniref:cytochrome o ubiquinol oxidase subunit IV n=1 Tax=Psychrobacter sp. HD31 TaxID=3112003 RepID=UPI003DA5C494